MRFISKFKKIVLYILLFSFFLLNFQVDTVYAANLHFYNYSTGSNVNYSDKQVIYTYNNRELPLEFPGILIDGTALADYEDLFVRELGLKAERNGNNIIISDGVTEIKLTFGSKKVLVNGIEDTMNVAPVKLKFDDTTKYYVPTRYVAETFGYSYVWVSDISTVRITKTLSLSCDDKKFSYNGTLYEIKYLNTRISLDMPVIFYNGRVIVPAKQIFEAIGCTYKETGNLVSVTKDELTLYLEVNNKIAYINSRKIISDSVPVHVMDCSTEKTELYVSLEFVADMLGFELTYSDKEKTYYIGENEFTGNSALHLGLNINLSNQEKQIGIKETEEKQPEHVFYEWIAGENTTPEKKYLSKVVAYAVDNAAVVELYGITRADINDFFDNGLVVFELKDVYSDMDIQYYSDYSASHLNYTLLTVLNTNTKLFFMIPSEDEWHIVEKEDCVQVYFLHADLSANDLNISSESMGLVYPDDKIIIPIHENVDVSHVSDEDNYLEHKFSIKISGNYVDFYNQNQIINPYYGIKIVEINYDIVNNLTNITFQTKSICGYKYTYENGYLAVTVAKPNEIYSKIVVFDAGHGGIDPGAAKNGIKEKDLNFKILNTYIKELFEDSDIKVYFTRETDIKVDLYERAAFASKVGADMFISLHMNSNNSSSISGTEVYYSKDNNTASDTGFNSYQLAKILVNNLSTTLNSKNRGALNSDFVVAKYNTVPAVLIELGYMTNKAEFSKLTDTAYQKKAAETIYQTVIQLFDIIYFVKPAFSAKMDIK